MLCFVGGFFYVFGLYADKLKRELHYDQATVSFLGAVGYFGGLTSYPFGTTKLYTGLAKEPHVWHHCFCSQQHNRSKSPPKTTSSVTCSLTLSRIVGWLYYAKGVKITILVLMSWTIIPLLLLYLTLAGIIREHSPYLVAFYFFFLGCGLCSMWLMRYDDMLSFFVSSVLRLPLIVCLPIKLILLLACSQGRARNNIEKP
jgi:hypothetical protein